MGNMISYLRTQKLAYIFVVVVVWSTFLHLDMYANLLLLSICELIWMRKGLSIVKVSSRCLEAVVETVSPILEVQGRKERKLWQLVWYNDGQTWDHEGRALPLRWPPRTKHALFLEK